MITLAECKFGIRQSGADEKAEIAAVKAAEQGTPVLPLHHPVEGEPEPPALRAVRPAVERTYDALCAYAFDEAVAWPSQQRLVADLGVAVRTVRNHIRALEAAGWITTAKRNVWIDGDGRQRRSKWDYTVYELHAPFATGDPTLRRIIRKAHEKRVLRARALASTANLPLNTVGESDGPSRRSFPTVPWCGCSWCRPDRPSRARKPHTPVLDEVARREAVEGFPLDREEVESIVRRYGAASGLSTQALVERTGKLGRGEALFDRSFVESDLLPLGVRVGERPGERSLPEANHHAALPGLGAAHGARDDGGGPHRHAEPKAALPSLAVPVDREIVEVGLQGLPREAAGGTAVAAREVEHLVAGLPPRVPLVIGEEVEQAPRRAEEVALIEGGRGRAGGEGGSVAHGHGAEATPHDDDALALERPNGGNAHGTEEADR